MIDFNKRKKRVVMKDSILKNKKIIILTLLVGIGLGWFLNNYYYINFYDVDSAIERLGLEDSDEGYLSLIEPISCTSSSQANENQGCEKLYDFSVDGWEDNGQNCNNQWIEINFEDENLVEFIVLQNYQYEGLLAQKDKIKDLEIVTSSGDIVNHTLSNSSDSQWIDINLSTSSLRFNILSSYETIGVENCHLESIDIYGRS